MDFVSLCLIPTHFHLQPLRQSLNCAVTASSLVHPEWSLMGLVLLDTPLGHGLNTKSSLSKAASVWKTYRGLELGDPDLWLRGLPRCKCWREPLTDWRCRELGRNHKVCALFVSPPMLPLPKPGRVSLPAL